MPDQGQTDEQGSILRRSASAYLYAPSSAYLTGAGVGIVAATLILLALGGGV